MRSQIKISPRTFSKQKSSSKILKILKYVSLLLLVIFFSHVLISAMYPSSRSKFDSMSDCHSDSGTPSWIFTNKHGEVINNTIETSRTDTFISKIRDSVNFLPHIDLSSSTSDTSGIWAFFNEQGESIENGKSSKGKALISRLRDSVASIPHGDISTSSASSDSSSDDTTASEATLDQSGEEARNSDDAEMKRLMSRLRDSVTFLPLKDLRYADTAMEGNTWFMSSLNDTYEENEAEYLYFPSKKSNGRLLCINASVGRVGTKNSYALAWPESLPESAKLMKGLTFISYTYYDYANLWHGLSAFAPFVGWSMKHGCAKPTRWSIFQQGSPQTKTEAWLQNIMQGSFGDIPIENFRESGDKPYCFEKALVMRHDLGRMALKKKHKVYKQIRCNARSFCGLNPEGKGQDLNEKGVPNIRLTLLMRRGTRAFKDPVAVMEIFRKECVKIEGCVLKVAQSDDLSFCDQVELLTYTDILASPHGAQLTNMIFMDKNSTVMEFYPKGWLKFAGLGQYCYQWLAMEAGMEHPEAWRETLDKLDCPTPQDKYRCWQFYKYGKVGHNETYFSEWARTILNKVKLRKKESSIELDTCTC
ncbi:hypothetical protein AKJ16_DCAP17102 [Drosera capensis]